jgi:hypothetical protein
VNRHEINYGNTSTAWHQHGDKIMPFDVVIDLGNKLNARGYKYLPDQYNVVVNANHPLVFRIHEEKEKKCRKDLDKFNEKLKPLQENKAELE